MTDGRDDTDTFALLLELWNEAIVANDPVAIRRFTDPKWVFVGENGVFGGEQFLESVATGQVTHDSMTADVHLPASTVTWRSSSPAFATVARLKATRSNSTSGQRMSSSAAELAGGASSRTSPPPKESPQPATQARVPNRNRRIAKSKQVKSNNDERAEVARTGQSGTPNRSGHRAVGAASIRSGRSLAAGTTRQVGRRASLGVERVPGGHRGGVSGRDTPVALWDRTAGGGEPSFRGAWRRVTGVRSAGRGGGVGDDVEHLPGVRDHRDVR